jgi:o-succinylbenzoate synthase
MQATFFKKTLKFKNPTLTSFGTMKKRVVWYLFLQQNDKIGIGEVAPLPGLSLDDIINIKNMLTDLIKDPQKYLNHKKLLQNYPAIKFALEMAHLDLTNGGGQTYFKSFNNIKTNTLIWMGDLTYQKQQIDKKIKQNFKCIKIKISPATFNDNLNLIKYIRDKNKNIKIRLDANGSFSYQDIKKKLPILATYDIHSIEQPIKQGQIKKMASLCKISPVPIALDEELIGVYKKKSYLIEKIKPQYIVLKPTLLGGFASCLEWINIACKLKVRYWITSSLESSVGLNAIAQFCAKYGGKNIYHGLGTGGLFAGNLPSHLKLKKDKLKIKKNEQWQKIYSLISKYLMPNNKLTFKTSGTTSSTNASKYLSFNKKQIKSSISLTKKAFNLSKNQTIALTLDTDYIAGAMQVLRAVELNLKLSVFPVTKDPLKNNKKKIDFVAMSPLQLYHTLKNNEEKNIKTIICGGGEISYTLADMIKNTQTQIFLSFGMTETLSHIALKNIKKDNFYHTLPTITVKKNKNNCLIINAPHIQKNDIETFDIVNLIDKHTFSFLGRYDNILNFDGIKIPAEVLEQKIKKIMPKNNLFLIQKGFTPALVIEGEENKNIKKINIRYKDKEYTIHNTYFIKKFIRTITNKINRLQTYARIARG